MNIEPKDCGKVKLEVRDWKSGGTKIIFMRCMKPLDCPLCGTISAQEYINPILEAGCVYTYEVHDSKWDAIRQHMHRNEYNGYGKYPISKEKFILVVTKEINKEFVVPINVSDWRPIVLATHDLDNKRRSATGVFSKSSVEEDFLDKFLVVWPEPVFRGTDGKTVATSALPKVITELLQYFTPLDDLKRENVNLYLDERARLKAALICLFYPEFKLVGFNEVSRVISDHILNDWSIVPMNDFSKAKLTNNPIGEIALKMLHSRNIPSYSEYPRNVHTWTDYKSEDEKVFDNLLSGTKWGKE